MSVFSTVKWMEASDYRRVTEVLYLGFVHGTLAALKRLLKRDRGMIIPDWFGAVVSVDSAAVGVLRGEACDSWVHRFAAL